MSSEHPSVYITTYSTIDVYECLAGDAPIMRRCKDNWVNATQILKLCDFPKAKRTKILERGVQKGLHEKVQGGYGRFQGTWIPLPEAQKLAEEYNITEDIAPVLYVNVDDPNIVITRKGKAPGSVKEGTPSKRKYIRKTNSGEVTPKKTKLDDHLPPSAVFTQDYKHTLSRSNSNIPQMGSVHMPQRAVAPQPPMPMGHVPSGAPHPEYMAANTMAGPEVSYQRPPSYAQFAMPDSSYTQQGMGQAPGPRPGLGAGHNMGMGSSHNLRSGAGQNMGQGSGPPIGPGAGQHSHVNYKTEYPHAMDEAPRHQMVYPQRAHGSLSHSTNDTNWSQEDHTRDSDTSLSSADHKQGNGASQGPMQSAADEDNTHVGQLLRFFSGDNMPIPYFLYNPPPDFNINEAIDDEGHTTLHWAASIGNLNLVHLLLSKGANPLVVSNFGLNPLSKCVSFNNCFDMKNFSLVVDALEMCLINTDINGRTPLHYLCQFSKVGSKLPALSYYMDVVFKKLATMSRNNPTGVDLVKNVIDHQDVNGDTCLHLAARAGCTHFVKFFLSHGARDDLLDLNNLSAKALIMQLDSVVYNFDQRPVSLPQQQQPYRYGRGPRPQGQAQAPVHAPTYHQKQVSEHFSEHASKHFSETPSKHFSEHAPVPRFQVTRPESTRSDDARPVASVLGTPIRTSTRRAETPDTQRTTVQDEDLDVDELHDRVSKEDFKSLLERQAGTVDDNKENIFVDEPAKAPHDGMSTPKAQVTMHVPKANVLGVISETAAEPLGASSPSGAHSPEPAALDKKGQFGSDPEQQTQLEIKLPMHDVSAMVSGMMNSLQTSYEEQLGGLESESERVKTELEEKSRHNAASERKVRALLDRNGFDSAPSLDKAMAQVAAEAQKCASELKNKEAQFSATLGKWHAYELAEMVEDYERQLGGSLEETPESDSEEKWALCVQLSKAQIKRRALASKLVERVRDFAINQKMNKYRQLISLSCGLKVEDIDGLIEGIEASLSEGTMPV